MDSDRVLKTGGPLDIWRRAVERQGGDIPEAIATGLTPSDIADSVIITCARLKEEHGKWRLEDVVKNLDASARHLAFNCVSGFEVTTRDNAEFWALGRTMDEEGHTVNLFRWSSLTGLKMMSLSILKICIGVAAKDLLGCNAKVLKRVDVGRGPDQQIYFRITTRASVGAPGVPRTIKWDDIWDYAAIKNHVRQYIGSWGGVNLGR